MEKYNPFSLQGKKILITGASSGIGRSIALECSKMGAELIIIGRDAVRLKETFDKLESSGNEFKCADLTSSEDIDELVKLLPHLDGVVHCAGIIKRVPLKLISENTYDQMLKVNLMAPVILTRKIYKAGLLKPYSSIVLISSVGADSASLGNIMYMTTKGGLNSFMKGSALELASEGIRVNSVAPGMIKTNLTKGIPDDELQKDVKRYPLGRYGTPEEVAYAVIYLLSDASKWMTGSILKIDGGLTIS